MFVALDVLLFAAGCSRRGGELFTLLMGRLILETWGLGERKKLQPKWPENRHCQQIEVTPPARHERCPWNFLLNQSARTQTPSQYPREMSAFPLACPQITITNKMSSRRPIGLHMFDFSLHPHLFWERSENSPSSSAIFDYKVNCRGHHALIKLLTMSARSPRVTTKLRNQQSIINYLSSTMTCIWSMSYIIWQIASVT